MNQTKSKWVAGLCLSWAFVPFFVSGHSNVSYKCSKVGFVSMLLLFQSLGLLMCDNSELV